MRQLTPSEMLSLRELLQQESNAMAKGRAMLPLITDDKLQEEAISGLQMMDARVKGFQQFIVENNIIQAEGVQ